MKSAVIRVLDVQDSPPFFTGQPYRRTIQEKVKLNTFVIKIRARDGDIGVSNPVNYTILPGKCSKLFNISKDGEIKTAAEIDRDSGDVNAVGGVCLLYILVQEEDLYPDRQFGNTTATTDVTITVEDMNDNDNTATSTTTKVTESVDDMENKASGFEKNTYITCFIICVFLHRVIVTA